MAKKLVTSYIFDASAQTIVSNDFTSLEKIQLITNVTDQIIIYNFADQAKGGSLTSTTLTLEYDTTSMADADKLQIFVDDPTVVQPISGTVTAELSATDNAVLDSIASAQLPDGHNVTVDNASLAVTGTFWQATQPISGTVTANAGTNLNTSALATEAGNLASIKAKTDNIPALGQALAAASVPVILPSATITTLTPPAAITGFATSAKQDTLIGHVDGVETLLGTIDADTSTLAATDFATEAKQDAIITAIGAIPGGGGTQYTEGDTDATITGTAALVEGGANALAVLTQPLTDTQLRATPVPISGSITADLGANNDVTVTSGSITATQATGTNLHVVVDSAPTTAVTGTFYQATQPVSGTVTANLSATDNAVLDAIAASTAAIETAVEGTLTVTGGGGGTEYTEGDIDATITGSVGLMEVADNTVQPIQGTVAGGLLVNLGSNNDVTVTGSVDLGATDNAVLDTIAAKDFATQTTLAAINTKLVTGTDIGDVTINNSTGAAAVNIQDGGNTITVDGTVAVTNAGITTIAGAVAGTEMQVDVLTMPTVTVNSHAVTNAGTFATQATLAAETTKVIGTVNIAASQTVGLVAGTAAIGKLAANSGVDIGDVTLTASSNNIGDVDVLTIAAGDNNIGNVDIVTLPALATGTNAIGRVGHDVTGVGHGVKVVTTAGTDVALAASTACKKVDIQSQTDNTSLIAVGGSGVDATVATGTGIVLYPGDVYSLEIDNLADIYIDSLVNGEGVRFSYYT